MTPTQLRNSILQTAITGRLVPQTESDGSAEQLLQQIEDEKRRLIADRNAAKIAAARAAGKSDAEIKKLKLEKYTAPKPVNPEDAPFEIPKSWRWTKLDWFINFKSGSTEKIENIKDDDWILDLEDIEKESGKILRKKTYKEIKSKSDKHSFKKGNVLYSKLRPYLNKVVIPDADGYCTSEILCFDFGLIYNRYAQFFLMSPYFVSYAMDGAYGTKMPRANADACNNAFFPLPPLPEQRRIVAKLEELLPLVEEYGEAQTELEVLNAALPDKLKKSLLQQAITGRLVPQTESDGSAEQLLLQIEDEKRRLIAERNAAKIAAARAAGKSDAEIKKLKLEKYTAPKPVNPEDAPFEIPQSWRWVRLGDVCEFLSRGKSPKYSDVKKYPVFAQKCNLKEGGISLEKALFLDPETLPKWSNDYKLRNGDVLINSTGTGTVCRTRLFDESCLGNYPFVVPDSHVSVVRTFQCINSPFVCYYIMSFSTQKFLEDNLSGSTNQKELSIGVLQNLLIPLPPLPEQRRIVAKLEEMFLEIEKLGNQE